MEDLSVGDVEGGEQRGCAVALVVVGHGLAAAFFHWQTGLGAVQSLYLTLLIDAEHQCVLGWIEVETDDIFELSGELRIIADLEAFHSMWLQSMRSPDAAHAGLRNLR